MELCEAYYWLKLGERRQNLLAVIHQPMTATQLARNLEMNRDCCSDVLWELSVYQLVECLNPNARRSRLYWLTELGKECQGRLRASLRKESLKYDFPSADWDLYGWCCFSHRSAIIKALEEPLQPAAVKRKARFQNPDIRMSANNVRDIIRLLLEKRIVIKVPPKGKVRPKYELTEDGKDLQVLLWESQS